MPTCFLVMGSPRSGTSLVAGVLHRLGVPMGLKIDDPSDPDRWDWSDPGEWNPRGHYQCAAFSNLENRFLGWTPPEGWTPSAEFFEQLSSVVSRRREQAARLGFPVWGAKTNRCFFYLDALRQIVGDVRLVVTRRPMNRSLASWRARGGFPGGEAIIRQANRWIAERLPADALLLDYDQLIDEPASAVVQLAACAGTAPTEAARNFIDPNLRRF